ncbi:hypothetical protein HYS42_00045 [Candidatus Saccharibacteria bacterium]|nr:hypothetical protein [Candidatus Saccharibacteria bacterium]
MPINGLSKIPIGEYKKYFPIGALEPLRKLPTDAKTLAEVEGFLFDTDALTILSGFAIAHSNTDGRLPIPGILLGSPDYLEKWGWRQPKDDFGLEQKDAQPVMTKLEENFGSMLAVSGVKRVVGNEEFFVPGELRIFGNGGPDFGMIYPLGSDGCKPITAAYNDGLTTSYSSRLPSGEVAVPVHRGGGKETTTIHNDPSAIYRCIAAIATIHINTETEQTIQRGLDIIRNGGEPQLKELSAA